MEQGSTCTPGIISFSILSFSCNFFIYFQSKEYCHCIMQEMLVTVSHQTQHKVRYIAVQMCIDINKNNKSMKDAAKMTINKADLK